MNQPTPPAIISAETAERLRADLEWIDERDWMRSLQSRSTARFGGFAPEAPLPATELRDRRQHLVEALRNRFEYAVVADEGGSAGTGMPLRLGRGVVYKVSPTLRESMADILGVILALLTTSGYFGLLAAWTGFAVWRIIRTLLKGFEQLQSSVERDVFETLFALSGRMTVVNYAALKASDYENAYGYMAPTAAEVAEACQPPRTPAEVEQALAAMQDREILKEKNGRWSICL